MTRADVARMRRASIAVMLVIGLLGSGCYSNQTRFAGWTFGGLTTVFGSAWVIANEHHACHRDDAGSCRESLSAGVDQAVAAGLVTTTGVAILLVTLLSSVPWHRAPRPQP